MRRAINIFIFSTLALAIGAGFYLYSANQTRIYPLPFKVAKSAYSAELGAQGADILIIGDDFGLSYSPYVENLIANLSGKLQKPLSIYNLSTKNEGIHRSLAKLKSLKSLPPIVIYMGGTREFYEQLYPKDTTKLELNYKIYQNDYIQTAIMLAPVLSRFLYSPDHIRTLGREVIPKEHHGDNWFQKVAEISLHFYKIQLEELMDTIIDKNSFPILVTPPINYETPISHSCDNSVTDEITIEQNEISNLIKKGNTKEAYNRAIMLEASSIGNAKTKELLAKTLLSQGKINQSKNNSILAKALDCDPKGAHPAINAIIKRTARNRSIDIVDFDKILNQKYAKDVLFLTKEQPQVIYWEKLTQELELKIKEVLEI